MVIQSEPMVRILAEIETEHHELTGLIARLPMDRISRRVGGHWSAVDLVAHITAWQANALRVAELQAAPDAPEVDPALSPGRILGLDTNRFNDDLLVTHRDWSLDQALAWHNEISRKLRLALAALPPSRLLGGSGPFGSRMWYGRPAIIHSREHRQEFERGL